MTTEFNPDDLLQDVISERNTKMHTLVTAAFDNYQDNLSAILTELRQDGTTDNFEEVMHIISQLVISIFGSAAVEVGINLESISEVGKFMALVNTEVMQMVQEQVTNGRIPTDS